MHTFMYEGLCVDGFNKGNLVSGRLLRVYEKVGLAIIWCSKSSFPYEVSIDSLTKIEKNKTIK